MKKILFLVFLSITAVAKGNWEYANSYYDDGSKLTFGLRAGIAMPMATMKNDLGSIQISYYEDGANHLFFNDSTCAGAGVCTLLGTGDLGKLGVNKEYSDYSWASGASVGMVMGGNTNIRLELDWLHLAETDFDVAPLFSGDIELSGGTVENKVASAKTTVSTDIVSAMFYYDFFNGLYKPLHTVIPYIGAGLGYANSTTSLALADNYGDLSQDLTIADFGEQNGPLIDFYTSETKTNNFALSGVLGLSYGINDGVFFDTGVRATYVPKIKWALNNSADPNKITEKARDIFSANDITFVNVYAGIRFEF